MIWANATRAPGNAGVVGAAPDDGCGDGLNKSTEPASRAGMRRFSSRMAEQDACHPRQGDMTSRCASCGLITRQQLPGSLCRGGRADAQHVTLLLCPRSLAQFLRWDTQRECLETAMSILGALTTAVSGLTAQSAAFTNISDNVANSQTVGYKAVDTDFEDYLTTSTAQVNESGSVATLPEYSNEVQGTITQSTDPLALAISGQGFFAVSEADGTVSGSTAPTFSPQTYYTRAGDFQMDSNGYLVNGAGEYLQGWSVDPATGAVNQSQLAPIQINQSQYNPVPTSEVNLAANLPASGASASGASSQVDVYDSLGNQQPVTLSWAQNSANDWTVTISSPNNQPSSTIGTAEVQFGTNGVSAGTIGSFGVLTGNVTASNFAAGSPATLTLTTNFGNGNQTIALNLGNFGEANGVTQFAASSYSLTSLSQNGLPAGSFTGVTMSDSGDVVANYNNGQSQTIAQVPVVTFADADSLQPQDGQAFTATASSGDPIAQSANSNEAGNLVAGSVESSNVDIATEFSDLIVAQQAYSANAKMVTSADQMLQTTINMMT
jgi:flagellar hook protein FlgE